MAYSYDDIDQALMRAKAHAAKEGRADYDMDAEFDELAKVHLLGWRRLEQLRPGAVEGPGDKGVRE